MFVFRAPLLLFAFVNRQIFCVQGDLSFCLVVDELSLTALAALRKKKPASLTADYQLPLCQTMPELTIEYTMHILPKTPGVSPRSFAVMILDEPFLPPQRSSLGF